MSGREARRRRVAKVCGADIEVGNFVLGLDRPGGTGAVASRALLREVAGVRAGGRPRSGYWTWADGTLVFVPADVATFGAWGHEQDYGRVYLPENGGCCYVDLDHLELALPEVRSARDCAAAAHAMFRIARRALHAANADMPDGQQIQVILNNSDHRSNSFGSHTNVMMSAQAHTDLLDRRLPYLGFLATQHVTSLPFTGAGKVGAENARTPVDFQISARADFCEMLVGPQTTERRPIVNARREALCGARSGERSGDLARLHAIFFDNTLCEGATLLRVGTLQIACALIEAECIDERLRLIDPVGDAVRVSHDPTLRTKLRLADGRALRAVEIQLELLALARAAHAHGWLDTVPEADAILDLWEDTLCRLERGDFDGLVGRLDWLLKQRALQTAIDSDPRLDWTSPEIRYLDLQYANLDEAQGLYWAYAAAGAVERHVEPDRIHELTVQPPDDTRAFTRAHLLRACRSTGVSHVDWDTLRRGDLRVDMPDPTRFTRAETGWLFEELDDPEPILLALGARGPSATHPWSRDADSTLH